MAGITGGSIDEGGDIGGQIWSRAELQDLHHATQHQYIGLGGQTLSKAKECSVGWPCGDSHLSCWIAPSVLTDAKCHQCRCRKSPSKTKDALPLTAMSKHPYSDARLHQGMGIPNHPAATQIHQRGSVTHVSPTLPAYITARKSELAKEPGFKHCPPHRERAWRGLDCALTHDPKHTPYHK